KQLLSQSVPGLAIDMPAGPSEVLVIADKGANPEFIAADLLSQAEHGEDSQVILLASDSQLIEETKAAIERQLSKLSR
ncbi:histidinol dehydrogenase, partial [Pseudoalteromonas sp. S1941]